MAASSYVRLPVNVNHAGSPERVAFIKLHASILDSSVWLEDDKTRIVWLTLMAMADRDGVVEASVPGLAHRARVARQACERAIAIFMSPDPDSRTDTDDGRRIEKVNGGWRLINYQPYRDKASPADVREKNARRQRAWRERNAVTPVTPLHNGQSQDVTSGDTGNDIAEVEVEDPDLSLSDSSPPCCSPPDQTRSEDRANVWTVYDWRRRYGGRWCEKYGGLAIGGDGAADGKMREHLEALPVPDLIAAQARAPEMFAEFLATGGEAATARHRWSWFVGRWNALRLPRATDASIPEKAQQSRAGVGAWLAEQKGVTG